MNVLVLGGGLVGTAIARDMQLDERFLVTVADHSAEALQRCSNFGLHVVQADVSDDATLAALLERTDLVLGALPGNMGFRVLRQAILAGKTVVDISFFPEDPFELDELAKQHNVTAVVDCGLAPGLSNLLLGRMNAELNHVESFLCLVGGLPVTRRKPYEYAAVFSPADVIEEYTRPARYVENGNMIVRPALSDVEEVELPVIGTLEAFNTDGLRTPMATIAAPNMKEKTLRYPGHATLMRMLRDTGFFGKQALDINGVAVAPMDVTARLLFPAWELPSNEHDLSVMRVVVEGSRDASVERHIFELLDYYDTVTECTSMARTTGYTCSVTARLLADDLYTRPGITPPEYLGADPQVYDALMEGLRQRGIAFSHRVEIL